MGTPTLKVLAATPQLFPLISWYNSQYRSEYALKVSPSFMDMVVRELNGFGTQLQVTNLASNARVNLS